MSFYSKLNPDEIKKIVVRDKLRTGISSIDTLFGFPTGFYLFCGNPGSGKGWFCTWLVYNSWKNSGKKSVLFSLEMAEELVRERVLQQWSFLTQEEYQQGHSTYEAVRVLQQDCLVIDDLASDFSAKTQLEQFKFMVDVYYKLGYRVFHLDHLHEIMGMNDNNVNQRVSESWGNTFQDICRKYPDIWMIVYIQPNGGAAEKNILRRTDIAGSKAITQKCDFFISINRGKADEDSIEDESRDVILYLDKSRVTTVSNRGFRLYFDETGNFIDTTDTTRIRNVQNSLL